jgi:septin family protein
VSLSASTYNISENNVNLKLTVIETIGFGDQINKENSYEIISNYINSLFETNLQQELEINRNFNPANDKLIHLCLYFLLPTGHSIKAIDLLTMKLLDDKINIVPLIAKSDTITKNELNEFKMRIRKELLDNNIKIYQFPTDDYDPNVSKLNQTINVRKNNQLNKILLFLKILNRK